MTAQLPPVPPQLKAIQHYLKTAAEHDVRDPVIAYWCRLHALQSGLKIDSKTKECVLLLTAVMDWLETKKKDLKDNEAITNDTVAAAHIENYAIKLFLWADTEDREARFNKNVVKVFYTSGLLFDLLTMFNEGKLTEEIAQNRKYAKWKAAYIHNCLKKGEQPVPGPMQDDEENFEGASGYSGGQNPDEGFSGSPGRGSAFPPDVPQHRPNSYPGTPPRSPSPPSQPPSRPQQPSNTMPIPGFHAPPTTPVGFVNPPSASSSSAQVPSARYEDFDNTPTPAGGVYLKPDDFAKAQKYCKWASSALQYEDAQTAISNLQKALKLLSTGKD